jgi:hypothetical protein
MNAKELVKALESTYGVKLPPRYEKFLLTKEYEKYSKVEFSGYFTGPYTLDFLDENLTDVVELGMAHGIDDIDDTPWSDDYASFVPLAALSHPDVDEPKMFLVIDVDKEANPVLVFAQEGWKLFPVSKSFEDFLKHLPKIKTDIKKSFTPGGDSEDE